MEKATPAATATALTGLDADWFDPLEDAVRSQVRAFIEQLLEEELEAALGRGRYERGPAAKGHRNGRRDRRLDTTFGPLVLAVPRARLADDDAGEREWRSELLPAYQRLSRRAELLIAQVYLAGVNTRRVRRALQTLFAGRIGKDAVSRAWRKTRTAWEAWQQRDLTREDVVRLILDGTVVKVRLDRRATAILYCTPFSKPRLREWRGRDARLRRHSALGSRAPNADRWRCSRRASGRGRRRRRPDWSIRAARPAPP
jgi:putative transposase